MFALVQLGVLEAVRGVGKEAAVEDGKHPSAPHWTPKAIRERVRRRLELVEDGDYFAVLGVAREATG